MLNFRKWNNFTCGSWKKIALYLNLILIYQNILVFEECFVLLLRHQLIIFIFNIPITSFRLSSIRSCIYGKTLKMKPKISNTNGSNCFFNNWYLISNIYRKFNFKFIASSLRESHSASDNGWSALVYDGKEFYHTKQYQVRIVDRVGSGDSFASGLIYGLVTGMSMQDAAEFGVAASALKHTIPGDLNHATLSEVKDLMKGDGSGRVQR